MSTSNTVTRRRSTEEDLDLAVGIVQDHATAWARLDVARKRGYVAEMRDRTAGEAAAWVRSASAAKGLKPGSPLQGEEWLSGPWAVLFALNRLSDTLHVVAGGGVPRFRRAAVRVNARGRVAVSVFPQSIYDRLLVGGVHAEVWMQEGVTPHNLVENTAAFYRQPAPEGRVTLVLGAGNIASIPLLDLLYKMFAEGHACILKMNPVNDYLGPFFEQICAAMIRDGFMRIVYGGSEAGAYLARHAGVDEIHITGSSTTHDAIVFGPGELGAVRKRRNEPVLNKRITSELGSVTPTIVLPGPWSSADVNFQASHIATQKMHNAGSNCIAAQVLVLPGEWRTSSPLLESVRRTLRAAPPRPAYYPGSLERCHDLIKHHAGDAGLDASAHRCTLITKLDPHSANEPCFASEAFGAVLTHTALPGSTAAEFLRHAVTFCNDRLSGTLGANLIVHPATMRELGPMLEEAIADLRYGCIGVNAWTGVGFFLAQTSWGAYPGHSLNNIGSGIGVVHNSYLFDKPEKSVIYGPFYPFPRGLQHGQFSLLPKPPWFVTNRRAHAIGRRLVRFEASPSPGHLPGIFFEALRG